MLRLDKIEKIYKTSDNEVHALKGLSICFRKNEFVSVLGPSGCGKTTLLNIIGGLDHYTSGDLLIEGRSTKDFTDRDWDVYRNHRIGFVFQSYNLIPHQNILQNVALALTIAGLGKSEREEKAKAALDRVGLKGLYKKMPNQLSGGQCQRVAIARALVNEPDILLADEPTGALDSVTSIQIMDLIKDISKEKLVIMVTHNPDLAEKYSTRIVRLLDGELTEDSNPFSSEEEQEENEKYSVKTEEQLNKEKAKMSLWTAFRLSGQNLWSKAKRTALIIMASSIGIVGVSAVLGVSSGVKGYIVGVQDDMLSGNPVTVSEEGFSLQNILTSLTDSQKTQAVVKSIEDGKININFLVEQLISMANNIGDASITNNITEDYVDFLDEMPREYYSAILKKFGIDPRYNFYTDVVLEREGGKEESVKYSINAIAAVASGIIANTAYSDYSSLVNTYSDCLYHLLDNEEYILNQYDIVEGHIPTKKDEILLVLNSKAEVTDLALTALGYYPQVDFMNAVDKFMGEPYNEERWAKMQSIPVETLMNKVITYYPNNSIYTPLYTPFVDEDDNPIIDENHPFEYQFEDDGTITGGTDLKVVGIVKPKSNIRYGSLKTGFYYTDEFVKQFIIDNLTSEISTFIRDYVAAKALEGTKVQGYTSGKATVGGTTITYGIYYDQTFYNKGEEITQTVFLGDSS
nr:ATP-binding cassette domain-containing protein [Bacilli bacterium]